jgi:NADH-quinone oxidoreductase subunit N
MSDLLEIILPELILVGMACVLFLVGVSTRVWARRLAPVLALVALAAAFALQFAVATGVRTGTPGADPWNTLHAGAFSDYVKLLTSGVGMLLVLLAWPTNPDATGSRSLNFGGDAGEFFALMLLSLAGVMLVSVANDIVLLFLAIELASIPTYVMVSISRPLPAAQEAGVKYFFLGAMAAAVMLFGFSYLYGTTGLTKLNEIGAAFQAARPAPPDGAGAGALSSTAPLTGWGTLAVVMLLAGFAFKIAAVPLHAYAGDVYQGAATPVTAFLAFVPKTSGMVAIIKLLATVGGTYWSFPPEITRLLWVLAALSMTVGNVLGLLQDNVKRVLAYSSIAHSGYMLVGLTALCAAGASTTDFSAAARVRGSALQGVYFYLAAYGIMNAAAFGVLMLLPSRADRQATRRRRGHADDVTPPATTAETYEDLAGQGRRHPLLGLAMAVSCFSLIGLPLTVGFFGKLYLIKPALDAKLFGLVVVTLVNAAISAAYYLQIVGTMFLRPDPATSEAMESDIADAEAERAATEKYPRRVFPIGAAVALSAGLTLALGAVFPATEQLSQQVHEAAMSHPAPPVSPTEAVTLAPRAD